MIEKLGLIIPAATLTKIAGNLGKGKTGKKNVERLFFFFLPFCSSNEPIPTDQPELTYRDVIERD